MAMTLDKTGDVAVVTITVKNMDASGGVAELKRVLTPLLEQNPKMIFDMSQVQFIDSMGCAMILSCLKRLNSLGGDLKLAGVNKPVRAIFELIRMHRIVEIFADKQQALKAFEG